MEVVSFFFPRTDSLRDYATFGFNATIVGLFAISAVTYVLFVLKYQFKEKPSLTKLEKLGKELDETKLIKKKNVLPRYNPRLICHMFTGAVMDLAGDKAAVQLSYIKNQIRSRVMNRFFIILAESGSRVLIILGLLGTLVGLGLTVYEVTELFTRMDLNSPTGAIELISGLSDPIQAMETALSTSIMGLSLSFFLFFMNMKFRAILELLLARANGTIAAYIVPKLKTIDISEDFKTLIKNQEVIADKVMKGFGGIEKSTTEIGAVQERFSQIVIQLEQMASRTMNPDSVYKQIQGYFNQMMAPFGEMSRATMRMSEELHANNLKVEEIVDRLSEETSRRLAMQLEHDRKEMVQELGQAVGRLTDKSEKNASHTANRILERLAEMRFGTGGYVFQFPSVKAFLLFVMALGVAAFTIWYNNGY
jgi:hypothetical protein